MNNLEYKALYRKYRPKSFSEVESQNHIVKTLQNIVRNNKVSHAYLFAGPRGTGKTSIAKIFASLINCDDLDENLQACSACLYSLENSMDIIEMDAASDNGVDEIRSLKEKAYNLPFKGKYKIYIIDEVHMLSKGAFNAFLKLLEEPPKHVVFILATTDPQKLPLTILSRLQRFNFQKIENISIQNKLSEILKAENIVCEPNALRKIAKLSNGSLRDAISMLDQLSIYSNNEIKESDLFDNFGITSLENELEILNLCNQQKLSEVLKLTNNLVLKGLDIELLLKELIGILKDYIIYKKTYDEQLLEYVNLEDFSKFHLSLQKAYSFLEVLVKLLRDIKFSHNPQDLFELGLIKLATQDQQLIENKQFEDLEKNVAVAPIVETPEKVIEESTTHEEPVVSEMQNNEPSQKSFSFDDLLFIPNKEEDEQETKDEASNNLEDMLFAATNPDDNENEALEKESENIVAQEKAIEVSEHELSQMESELENEEFEEETDEDTLKKQHFVSNVPFTSIDDIISPSLKKYQPERETDPEKLLAMSKVSNNSIIEGVEVNKELEKLKQSTLLEEALLEKSYFEDEELEEGMLDSEQETISMEELTLAKSITAEINLAKERGEVIEKDLYSIEQILNLIALGSREKLNAYKFRWNILEALQHTEKYYNYIPYLMNAKLIAAGEDYILISSTDDQNIWKINSFSKDWAFAELIAKIIEKPVHAIAISKKLFIESKEAWQNLEEKPEGIPLAPVQLKNKKEITEDYAKSLIGTDELKLK